MATHVFNLASATPANSDIVKAMKTLPATSIASLRLLLALVASGFVADGQAAPVTTENPASRRALLSLPLYFEAVQDGSADGFQFVARGPHHSVQLSGQRAVLSLIKADRPAGGGRGQSEPELVTGRAVEFEFLGANRRARLVGEGELPGRVNYFIGNDPAAWRRGLSTFGRVRATEVYRGVDLVYYGNQERLEYDFIVQPGASPKEISFRVTGADQLRVDANGDLVIALGGDEVRQLKPIAYQDIAGVRQTVHAAYRVRGQTVSFELGTYDRTQPLVIDPILNLIGVVRGSASDVLWDVAIYQPGTNKFLLVAGETMSANLSATAGAFTNKYAGGSTFGGDAFVIKLDLNNAESNLVYLTYLGGRSHDGALSLAADGEGNAYLTGYTASTNFPTVGPLRTNLNGGILTTPSVQNTDAFVTKLSPDGSNLVYSAFLGGSAGEQAYGIAVSDAGVAFVTGFSQSTNFPTANTTRTNQSGGGDVFLTSISSNGQSFAYSFLFGGLASDRGEAVITDPDGNAYVAGFTRSVDFPVTTNLAFQAQHNRRTNATTTADAFLLKVSAAGVVDYATFLGGESDDIAFNLMRDTAGALYVCGATASTNFIVTATNVPNTLATNKGVTDAFVVKFDPTLTNLAYAVAFGGVAKEEAWDMAVDSKGRLLLVGDTSSLNLPVTNTGNFLNIVNSGASDAMVGRLNTNGTAFEYLGYLGGNGDDLAYALKLDVDDIYFVGKNGSANFPTAPALGGTADGFVAWLADVPARLVVSPDSLIFTPVLTGAVAQASFVVTNAGSTTLNTTASLTSDLFFLLATNSTPVTNLDFALPAFTATNIPVRFVAPDSIGWYTNEVVFVSNGGDSTNPVAGVGFDTPVIVDPWASDTNFFFSFETISGVSYDVQFKDVIDDTNSWQLLQTISGDDTLKIVTNLTATSTQRFFRLHPH